MDAATDAAVLEEDHSSDITPLPSVLRHGLAAVATFGLLSFITTAGLLIFLTYKLVSWQIRPLKPRRAKAPSRPESPEAFDHNGFLVPSRPLSMSSAPEESPQDDTFWERLRKEPPNQFLILILNLFLADTQQALAFLLSFDWIVRDGVVSGTSTCWTQGWFVSNGDLASSIFITGIALHTYLGVVRGYRLPSWAFYWAVGSMWGFVYFVNFLAVLMTDNGREAGGLFVRTGAWCWWNPVFRDMRLYLHYLWIFLSLAATCAIYTVIFFHLRRLKRQGGRARRRASTSPPSPSPSITRSNSRMKHYPNPDPNWAAKPPGSPTSLAGSMSSTASSLNKELPPIPDSARQQTFLLYPLIYLVCTVPLAAGRLASMTGNEVSLAYFCFAGSMIACNGWMDVALYSYTRRAIVFADGPPSQDTGIDTFAFMRTPPARKYGNVVIVHGGQDEKRKGERWGGGVIKGSRVGRLKALGKGNGSEEELKGFGMGKGEVMGMAIRCETTTTVSVEYDDGSKERTLA